MATGQAPSPVAAVVLAGGASRRMGREKALLTLPDGRTMLEATLGAARAVAAPVWLAVDTAEHGERLRRAIPGPVPPLLLDNSPGAGPLASLAGALAAAPTAALLALAVDTPLVRPTLLRALLDVLEGEEGILDIALPVVGGVEQPFPACYSSRLAGLAGRLLEAGERGPRALLSAPGVRVRRLDEAALRMSDPDLRSFASANTPEEWARLLALAFTF